MKERIRLLTWFVSRKSSLISYLFTSYSPFPCPTRLDILTWLLGLRIHTTAIEE